jgi:LmbE family N-acetylglucosaminyl deacetylase
MIDSSIKNYARQLYKQRFKRLSNRYTVENFSLKTIIFSPHFDDETLGCGGTIIQKKKFGADVKIVYMTDGSKSHTHLISEEDSRSIRKREGLDAGRALGLSSQDIYFLDFEETRLNRYMESAIQRVLQILQEVYPEEIFLPYYKEPLLWSEDHLATNRIIKDALKLYKKEMIICEYPIWFWCHWPWAKIPLPRRRLIFRHIKNHGFHRGLYSLRDFNYAVFIGDLLEQKRHALEQHKSQMTRLIPDSRWRTLADVSNGEFLKCFFQEYEMFYKYV